MARPSPGGYLVAKWFLGHYVKQINSWLLKSFRVFMASFKWILRLSETALVTEPFYEHK